MEKLGGCRRQLCHMTLPLRVFVCSIEKVSNV